MNASTRIRTRIALAVAGGAALGCRSNDDASRATPASPSSGTATPASTTGGPSGSSAAHTGYRVRAIEQAHAIEVRVRFTGSKRAPAWSIPPMVRAQCGGVDHVSDEALVVAPDGGLSDAVVWLDDIHEGAPLPTDAPATQDEKGCVFTPHVLALPATGMFRLTNSDPANHAVRFEFGPGDDTSDDFMKTLPAGGSYGIEMRPEWAGRYARLTCPIHLWMWSYVHFFDHPYFAVTKAGVARLEKVPPGSYHVSVWHEGIGVSYASSLKLTPPVSTRAEVTVKDSDAHVAFAMGEDGTLASQ